jgi:hypothetical protein
MNEQKQNMNINTEDLAVSILRYISRWIKGDTTDQTCGQKRMNFKNAHYVCDVKTSLPEISYDINSI